ncbi:hypothetical protein PROFUN_07989 [Planoprotostelium fungivorum]|uniref:Uncharacterized protein n=1 Tax=Planoprotostelium fungivorum TaxID=1890364 RepID=A0A2P6MVB1_9EUKA|nr:hypothetical protein PROFUN_07989 [Planoprotostelium fungivorum]
MTRKTTRKKPPPYQVSLNLLYFADLQDFTEHRNSTTRSIREQIINKMQDKREMANAKTPSSIGPHLAWIPFGLCIIVSIIFIAFSINARNTLPILFVLSAVICIPILFFYARGLKSSSDTLQNVSMTVIALGVSACILVALNLGLVSFLWLFAWSGSESDCIFSTHSDSCSNGRYSFLLFLPPIPLFCFLVLFPLWLTRRYINKCGSYITLSTV